MNPTESEVAIINLDEIGSKADPEADNGEIRPGVVSHKHDLVRWSKVVHISKN